MSKPCQPWRWGGGNPSAPPWRSLPDLLFLPVTGLAGVHTGPETEWKWVAGSLLSINRKENILFVYNPGAGFFRFFACFWIQLTKFPVVWHGEEVYLGHASSPYMPGTHNWLFCLLLKYLCGCEECKDVGGHGADRVDGEQCSVCASQGSWKSLALCYWGQYLVVVKWPGSDCSHISASLGVTLEVKLMSVVV